MSKEPKREDQPNKGILKTPSQSSERAPSEHRKSAHWDEDNIRETRQRGNEDDMLMKANEPKTPFNWKSGSESPSTSRGGEVSLGIDDDKTKENIQNSSANSSEKVVEEKSVLDIQRKFQANALQGQDADIDDYDDDETREVKPDGSRSDTKEKEEKKPGPKGKSSQRKLPQKKKIKKE